MSLNTAGHPAKICNTFVSPAMMYGSELGGSEGLRKRVS